MNPAFALHGIDKRAADRFRVSSDSLEEMLNPSPYPTHLRNGRFSLVSLLGEGGMASVYRAFDHELKVWRAVKLLSPKFAETSSARRRFTTEAQAMAALEDAHIVRIYDVGVEGHFPYIVMELAEGGCPAVWLKRHGPMPPRMAVDVTIQICQGLQAAHKRGIVHRDIKPHNVLVDSAGKCKVTDFGIARVLYDGNSLTQTGSVMGTPAFMAPEQRVNTKAVDHRTDIYAAGATLYTLLTRTTTMRLYHAAMDPEILDGIPDVLAKPLLRATAYQADDRYDRVVDFARDLLMVRAKLPVDPASTPPLQLPLDDVMPPERVTPSGTEQQGDVADQRVEQAAIGSTVHPPEVPASLRGWKNIPGAQARPYPVADNSTIATPKVPAQAPTLAPEKAMAAARTEAAAPLTPVQVSATEAAWLVIHRECEPKRLHGEGRPMHGLMAIEHHLDLRALGESLAAAAAAHGLPSNRVKTRIETDSGPHWVTAEMVASETRNLDAFAAECNTCTSRIRNLPYGCFVRLPYPIPSRGEEWLMDHLQVAGSLGGDLCMNMISTGKITGEPIAELRAHGAFQSSAPLVKVVKRGWMVNSKISSDQLFHALLMADLEFLNPFNCLAVAFWFAVIEIDGVEPGKVTEDGLAAVASLKSREERLARTRIRLGPRTADPAIQYVQNILVSLYLAWAHDVRLLVEP